MPTGFGPTRPVRGALSSPTLPPMNPAIAPGMRPGPAPQPLAGQPSAAPMPPQGALPSPPQPGAPGAMPQPPMMPPGAMPQPPMMPPQGPQMPAGASPQMGGAVPPPMAGPPPAAPGGPQGGAPKATGMDSLISRVLKLMQPPPPEPPPGGMGMPSMQGAGIGGGPLAPPTGGMGNPMSGGDPRAQIMQMLAMAGGGGGGPPGGMPPMGGGQRLGMARGGYPFDYLSTRPGLPVRGFAMGGPMFGPMTMPMSFGRGDYVPADGRGDGRSDHVPAKLSPGEYVMDAETVALLGNGDNTAGARRLDQMRQNVRQSKGKALAKGRFSPNAKEPESYLPKKPRGRA